MSMLGDKAISVIIIHLIAAGLPKNFQQQQQKRNPRHQIQHFLIKSNLFLLFYINIKKALLSKRIYDILLSSKIYFNLFKKLFIFNMTCIALILTCEICNFEDFDCDLSQKSNISLTKTKTKEATSE